jgi:hypothetical protein
MEHRTIEGIEDETEERLNKLRALASAQNDPEMLWAIETEVCFLLAVRDELRRWNRAPSKAS